VLAREYLKINPLGTIPFFVDGDAKMTESSGICAYLAETHAPTPLRVAPGEADYASYLNWLFFSDATLTFPQTLVLRYTMLEPEARRQSQVAEDYAKWFHGRLRHVETALADGREWLVAGRFTMADIVIAYALHLATTLPPLRDTLPERSMAYLQRCRARPAFQRAREKQKG
jgi:glutathione S-transferase